MSSPSGVLLGSQQPSHLLLPSPVVPSGAAEDAIDLAAVAGLELDDWQQDVLRGAMSMRPDGRWAAFEVGVVVPRQNGKGSILEARQLAGLFVLGERLQIHTAHEFKTCFEHFRRVKDLVEGCDLLRAQVKIIRTGAGDQAIELKNGNRLRFLARSRSSGRGFSADVIYLDEAFLLSDATMGALLPALSARENPQIWFTSSAPHADSEVLHRVRLRGRAGEESRLFYAEWGCDQGADPADRANWYVANPALGVRIDEESVESEWRSLSPEEFARERLGVAEEPEEVSTPVDMAVWADLAVRGVIASHHQLALDVSIDRKWASFAAAGRRSNGRPHAEIFERRPGTDWVLERGVEAYRRSGCPIRILSGSPAAAFIARFREAGVEVDEVAPEEYAREVGQFLDWVTNRELVHLGDPSLEAALRGAEVSVSSSGATVWARKSSRTDISPLVAVTVALGGLPSTVVLGPDAGVW